MRQSHGLQRREKARSGIERAPARRFPAHRTFVRKHKCVSCGGSDQIECAHLRIETMGGTGFKPADFWCLPLCARCHFSQHTHTGGERGFWDWPEDKIVLPADQMEEG